MRFLDTCFVSAVAIAGLAACQTADNAPLRSAEDAIGTDTVTYRGLHRILEHPRGYGLLAGGYLLGFEKAVATPEEHIPMHRSPPPESKCPKAGPEVTDSPALYPDIAANCGAESLPADLKKELVGKRVEKYEDWLTDRRVTFPSHFMKFGLAESDKTGVHRIKGCEWYNAYATVNEAYNTEVLYGDPGPRSYRCKIPPHQEASDKNTHHFWPGPAESPVMGRLMRDGWVAVQKIAKQIAKEAKDQGRTHIIIYSMGWNTQQDEAIQNFNSLFGHLLDEAAADTSMPFKPLMVGASWPSLWQTNLSLVRTISYFTKADDADEMGAVWMSLLLDRLATELGTDQEGAHPRLVVIGHSFGTRLTTRAVFSRHLVNPAAPRKPYVDLVIGLQGAVSINRFLPDTSDEGAPYADYANTARKFVFTWSKFDTANPVAFWTDHIGAAESDEVAADHPKTFQRFALNADGTVKGDTKLNSGSDRIAHVDATLVIRNGVPFHGGEAHSDIYKRQVAHFVWETIKETAP